MGIGTIFVSASLHSHDGYTNARHVLLNIPGFECRPGEGTFYAFPRVTGAISSLGLKSDVEFNEYLLDKANVVLVPGSAFGAPGYLRLSFACSMESLEEAIKRIRHAVTA